MESMEEAVVSRGGTRCLRPHHLQHGAQRVLEPFPRFLVLVVTLQETDNGHCKLYAQNRQEFLSKDFLGN